MNQALSIRRCWHHYREEVLGPEVVGTGSTGGHIVDTYKPLPVACRHRFAARESSHKGAGASCTRVATHLCSTSRGGVALKVVVPVLVTCKSGGMVSGSGQWTLHTGGVDG